MATTKFERRVFICFVSPRDLNDNDGFIYNALFFDKDSQLFCNYDAKKLTKTNPAFQRIVIFWNELNDVNKPANKIDLHLVNQLKARLVKKFEEGSCDQYQYAKIRTQIDLIQINEVKDEESYEAFKEKVKDLIEEEKIYSEFFFLFGGTQQLSFGVLEAALLKDSANRSRFFLYLSTQEINSKNIYEIFKMPEISGT